MTLRWFHCTVCIFIRSHWHCLIWEAWNNRERHPLLTTSICAPCQVGQSFCELKLYFLGLMESINGFYLIWYRLSVISFASFTKEVFKWHEYFAWRMLSVKVPQLWIRVHALAFLRDKQEWVICVKIFFEKCCCKHTTNSWQLDEIGWNIVTIC